MKAMFSCGAFVRLGIALLATWPALAVAADPQVSNVQAAQRAGTKLVDITYDVTATNAVSVSVTVSTNSGSTYDLPATHFSGSGYGAGVTPGTGKAIVWDAGADWDGQYSMLMRVKITADDSSNPPIPPDPSTVATVPSNGVVSLLYDSTAFLYTGANAIQLGMVPGTITNTRVAVVRGRVIDRSANPLSGVTVTVNNHPEYGYTVSRTNGWYDLVVNGGGSLGFNYARSGYLTVQRVQEVPWQEYVVLDDVALVLEEGVTAVINLPADTGMTAVQGTEVTDERGTRNLLVVMPSNATATIRYLDGTMRSVPLEPANMRVTEYTVGTNGESAMPGELPPSVAYTYAVKIDAPTITSGQGLRGRIKDVVTPTNIYCYVDNFLSFPNGTLVPNGYYDVRGGWIPEDNGVVMRVLGTNASGLARISVASNYAEASAEDLASLDFTDQELKAIAAMTTSGTGLKQGKGISTANTYQRMRVILGKNMDFNQPKANPNAKPPAVKPPKNGGADATVSKPSSQNTGGQVFIENQSFGETLPVAGTPFVMHYNSENVAGYGAASYVDITLSDDNFPGDAVGIKLYVNVAGRTFSTNFPPASNLTYRFTWDGKDAYGRWVSGMQYAQVAIDYLYDPIYKIFFHTRYGHPILFGRPGYNLPVSTQFRPPPNPPTVVGKSFKVPLSCGSAPNTGINGLGGWTLNAHHSYDPLSRTLHYGTGAKRTATGIEETLNNTIVTVAGNGTTGFGGDGGPATNAAMDQPTDLVVGPDGSIYFIDGANWRVRCINKAGIITTVAGNGTSTYSGDGVAATNTGLLPAGLAMGPDGSFYIGDGSLRIYRVGTNGILTCIAGCGDSSNYETNEVAATNASVNPEGLAIAEDGTVYFAEPTTHRVRQILPDGRITTLAGIYNQAGYTGDDGSATNATLDGPACVALGPNGAVYIGDRGNNCIRQVTADGIISTLAGGGNQVTGDGIDAKLAEFKATGLAVGSDGSLFIVSNYGGVFVRRVSPDGIIATIAGGSGTAYNGDGLPARKSGIWPDHIALNPADGAIYVTDKSNERVRQIVAPFPGLYGSDMLIPSEDASLLYAFDQSGRHLRTYNALTGATIYEFGYTNGWLASITDGDNNVTRIERAADGTPSAIVGPYGQRTVLTLNSEGYLASAQDPLSQVTTLGYATNGLLSSVTGPRGPAFTYSVAYDSVGRVTREQDPAGGSLALGRSGTSTNEWTSYATSALGRVTTVLVEPRLSGDRRTLTTEPDGTQDELVETTTGVLTNRLADGTVIVRQLAPDPRFYMQAPYVERTTVRLPYGNLALTATVSQAVTMTGGSSLAIGILSNRTAINGREYVSVFQASARTITVSTPVGRTGILRLDSMGRVVSSETPSLATVTNQYDIYGRLASTRAGDREVTFQYDTNGYLSKIVDPLGRTNSMTRDALGQITVQTRPDGNAVSMLCDEHGNIVSVTPPGRPAHTFGYSPVDLATNYTAPGADPISTERNADRQPTRVRLPGNQTMDLTYDFAGRPGTNTLAEDSIRFAYDASGRLASLAATSSVTINFGYNGFLVTTQRWTGAVTGLMAWTYDNNFRLTSRRVNATTVNCGYDNDGLLTNAGACVYTCAAANGLLMGSAIGVVTDAYEYNLYGEITNYTACSNGAVIYACAYNYDKLGRITSHSETIQGDTIASAYGYDVLGQLTSAVAIATGGAISYTNYYAYDANGNRTNWVLSGTAYSASYDNQDRLLSWTGGSNLFSAAGFVTNRIVNGTNYVYRYDVMGALRSAVLPAGGSATNIEYVIDGLGRRAGRKVDGVMSNGWLYAGGIAPLAEMAGGTNLSKVFVYGRRSNVPDYYIAAGITNRIITDHLGSPRLVVNAATGEIVQRVDYDEWGRVLTNSASSFQPFGFAGGLADSGSGLVRFGARDYDPQTGRWTAKDPVLFAGGSPNLYAYCANNPIRYVDPTGFGPNAKDPTGFGPHAKGYDTMWDAGKAALDWINGTSIKQNREYGGSIYQGSDGKYYFNNPWPGLMGNCIPNPFIPGGTKKVAGYHTHGAPDPTSNVNVFSDTDLEVVNKGVLPEFLGTPEQGYQVYTPPMTTSDHARIHWLESLTTEQ